ncbi:MAG: hypothetical protein ACJ74O_18940 [Frankiaceae bacterium]
MTTPLPRSYYSAAETASFVEATLRHAFPGVEFEVAVERRDDGHHLTVRWPDDGPDVLAVHRLVRCFVGKQPDPDHPGEMRDVTTLLLDDIGEPWEARFPVVAVTAQRVRPVEPYPVSIGRRWAGRLRLRR